MIETGVICLTALVIVWLGRGAHDLRLRDRAAERKATDTANVEARVANLEPRVTKLEVDTARDRTAAALAGRKR